MIKSWLDLPYDKYNWEQMMNFKQTIDILINRYKDSDDFICDVFMDDGMIQKLFGGKNIINMRDKPEEDGRYDGWKLGTFVIYVQKNTDNLMHWEDGKTILSLNDIQQLEILKKLAYLFLERFELKSKHKNIDLIIILYMNKIILQIKNIEEQIDLYSKFII